MSHCTASDMISDILNLLPTAQCAIRKGRTVVRLNIDDNFELFFEPFTSDCVWPYIRCTIVEKHENEALTFRSAKVETNMTNNHRAWTEQQIRQATEEVIRKVANYLSEEGQKRTYASITLKTTTGVSGVK